MRHATATQPPAPGFYTWRDPAKYTARQLAAMAAHDARFATAEDSPKLARGQEMRARAAARRKKFAELREAGVPVEQAAERIEVSVKYARRMERDRVKEAGQ